MRRGAAPSRTSDPGHAQTRQALLEAAAEVFARRGYAATTVREICEKAGANIAAVNYHFGDKGQLYTEVLQHALRCAHEKFPPSLGLPDTAPPETRLRAFIESFLLRTFDDGPHSFHGQLLSREMIDPTRALDALVQNELQPRWTQLHQIVSELLGADAKDETIRLCALSVVSQCTFYHHCRPVLTRLFPEMTVGPQTIRQLATHITEFSLAGIRQQQRPSARVRR